MNLDEKGRKTEGQKNKKREKPKCAQMVYDELRGTRTKRHKYTKPKKYREGQTKIY